MRPLAAGGPVVGEWGLSQDSAAGRKVFAERMERRRGQDLRGEFKRGARGWCLGEEVRQDCWSRWTRGQGRAILGRPCRRRRRCRWSG